MVELLTAYSRMSNPVTKFRDLLNLPPDQHRCDPRLPYRHQPRMKPEQVAEAAAAYAAGATLPELATRFGVHRKSLARVLKRAGVQFRYNLLTNEQVAEAGRLYAEGLSLMAVGDRLHVDGSTVRRAFVRAGIPTRPRQGR